MAKRVTQQLVAAMLANLRHTDGGNEPKRRLAQAPDRNSLRISQCLRLLSNVVKGGGMA